MTTTTAPSTPAGGRSATRRSTRTPQQRRNFFWGLVFTSPAIIGLLWFTAYPVLVSLYYSFTSATMMKPAEWLGLGNYESLLSDSSWWSSLGNTLYYIVVSVPLGIAVALFLAILLNLNVRGQSIYRVIFYLPAIVPLVASAVVWLYVFNPQYGVLNTVLGWFGITGPGWLASPEWAMPALIIFSTWGAGNLMIILLAGLQDVPQDLHDQAKVDGAGVFRRFRHVSLPFLSPHLLFALVTGLIAGFQFFTPVFVLTNGTGGPAGKTLVSGLYLYQNAFQFFKVGYASAIAWVLFIIVGLGTALVFRLVGRRVYYGGA
ncbi:carbohydrate ABC transporter permease [Actinopolymorpha singaporensis]|uniref:Carbohydrate ABC transporter membrane protein 1, CUT1 family n=1 Tax=Actinopolymorpha singaporensis TaxID=117157 RepID=A0A1H1LE80_9ACTN|nr:sugar ABC transporter permease [Actinopolymorpha singaporensis]SDR72717.1 carbohydrate ABC transporter membrane protein 1, CUT1 family [Actinopolymorpha singaporensis]